MLKIVDFSNNNYMSNGTLKPNCEVAYREADGVIMKATQGIGFVDPYCNLMIERAKRDGKVWGFYHYAGGYNPIAEAVFFYNNCKNYFGHGIPVIDFEEFQNEPNWDNTSWVRQFVNKIHELSGIWCMIYIQQSAIAKVANCVNDCALWVAAYPDVNNNTWNAGHMLGSTTPWGVWTLWQYTAAVGCDRSMGNLDRAAWARIAGSKGVTSSKPSTPAKDYNAMARDVIAGKYGNGDERKRKLGADYNKVQAIVNTMVGNTTPPQYKTYVVKAGDTLIGVFGNDWQRVARLNKLANPNLIYPGQKLLY